MMVMTETEEDEAEEENDARSLSLVSVYGLRQIVVAAAAAVAALLSEIRRVIARLRLQRSARNLFLGCVSLPQRPEATHAT